MAGRIAMSALLWALTGAFVGASLSTFVGRQGTPMPYAVTVGVIAVAVGWSAPLRGKIGVPLVAGSLALVGWVIGFIFQSTWQIGAVLIVAGATGGTYLGYRLQERFTRNTRRAGASDFYRR